MKKILFVLIFLGFSLSTYAKVEENYDYINEKYARTLNQYSASFSFTGGLVFKNEINIGDVVVDYTAIDLKKDVVDKKVKEFMDFEFYGASKPSSDCKISTNGNLRNIRDSIFSAYSINGGEVEKEFKTLSELQTEIPLLYSNFKTKYDNNIKYAGSILENYNADYLIIKDKYVQYMTTKKKINESFKNIYSISNLTYQTCIKPQLEAQEWYAKNSPKTETKGSSFSKNSDNKKAATSQKPSGDTKKATPSDERVIKSNTDYLLKLIKKEGEKLSKENKIAIYKQVLAELNKLIESENIQK